jgi:hypothetical protein
VTAAQRSPHNNRLRSPALWEGRRGPVIYHSHMVDTANLDTFPLTVRGPLSTNSSHVVTFARAFVHNGRLYIAESGDKGKTIRHVTSYPIGDDWEFVRRGSKTASFGPFKWSGCGCSSKWNTWTTAQLAELDETPADTVDA